MLHSKSIVCGELEENCYIVWLEGSKDAIVFDPGDEPEKIQAELDAHGLTIAAFIQTHCHGDHIAALTPLKGAYPEALLYCPEAEAEWLAKPTLNLSYFYGHSVTAPPPDQLVRDDDMLRAAGLELRAIHVPGHSPGGTAYFIEAQGKAGSPPHLYCGDILFAGSIGRTDLPGGEGETMLISGIREKLFILPDETVVCPGHGPETTIGQEKETNPYCR